MRKGYNALADLRERRSVFEMVLDRDGDRLPGAQGLSDIAHRKLGQEALWAAGHAYGRARTEPAYVDELTAFAVECWPQVSRHALYRTLRSRKRIGPRAASFMFTHKAQWWLRRRSWKYRGF
jgi:hypothetical protein